MERRGSASEEEAVSTVHMHAGEFKAAGEEGRCRFVFCIMKNTPAVHGREAGVGQ
jgi:hypothetical protein